MQKMKNWWERDDLTVEFNASSNEDSQGTLLIGLGSPEASVTGVCLNPKGLLKGSLSSVSALVDGAEPGLKQQWRQRLGNTQAVRKIVVEDFSLDTCHALLMFGALLDQTETENFGQPAWLDYVNAWEMGRYLDGGDVSRSAACLLTSLAHSFLPEGMEETISNSFVARGLFACLNFLQQLCAAQANPLNGIDRLDSAEYARALGQLAHEQQMYRLALQRSQRCQLLVPLRESTRQLIVDALFLTEVQPSGILKILARTDRENTWTHQGFGLLAIHRPQERGTGNDMVISLDPANGAELGGVWRLLEQQENELWAGERPRSNPRPLTSYRDPQNPARLLPGAPDQPWYDGGGNYSLLAAPKRMPSCEAGSKLSWRTHVTATVWQSCFLTPVQTLVQKLSSAAPAPNTSTCKRIVTMRCAGDAGEQGLRHERAILETPTFQAWLAAQSMLEHPVNNPYELPPFESFEIQRVGSVDVLVSRSGVTLFDWSENSAHMQPALLVAEKVASASYAYCEFLEQNAGRLAQWTHELLDTSNKRTSKRNQHNWTHELMQVKVQALAALGNSTLLESDFDLNELSMRLQRVWGLSDQRSELMGLIDRIDELMRQAISLRSATRQRLFGAILSSLGLGLLASHVWEPVRGYLTTNMFEWQLKMSREVPPPTYEQLQSIAESASRYELFTVIIVLSFSCVGFLLYWLFDIRGNSED